MPRVWTRPTRPGNPVLAVCMSDVHLSLKAPIARSGEKNWLKAMKRSLTEINELAQKHNAILLCAGDIFDKWNVVPELINFALQNLSVMYAIPGNHDLPNHQPELIHRSAFWTLVKAGIVKVVGEEPIFLHKPRDQKRSITLYGRPFDGKVPKRDKGFLSGKNKYGLPDLHVLLTHEYLWVPGKQYNGATQDTRLGCRVKDFRKFDVVVVGDNHAAFTRTLKNGTHVINCGTVFRRRSDEALYCPRVGLIHEDGEVSEHRLDTSKDVFLKSVTKEMEEADDVEMSDFIQELAGLEATGLDFRDAVKQAMRMRKSPKLVRQLMSEAME